MNSCIDVGQRALCNELDLEIKSLLTVLLYYCTTAWLYVCTTKGGAQLNNTSQKQRRRQLVSFVYRSSWKGSGDTAASHFRIINYLLLHNCN